MGKVAVFLSTAGLLATSALAVHCSSNPDGGSSGDPSSSSSSSGSSSGSTSSSSSGGSSSGSSSSGGADAGGDAATDGPTDGSAGDGGTSLTGCATINPTWTDGETLLATGHTTTLEAVGRSGSHVLGLSGADWILWDAVTHTVLTRGGGSFAHVVGGTFIVGRTSGANAGFEVRSMATGAVLHAFPTANLSTFVTTPRLSVDATYVWAWTSGTTIAAWSLTGTQLVTAVCRVSTGRVAATAVYAAPGELRAACAPGGPPTWQGMTAMTRYPLDGSAPTELGPYSGVGLGWYANGSRFIVRAGSDATVRELDGTIVGSVLGAASFEEMGGDGNYAWGRLQGFGEPTIYPMPGVGTPITPVALSAAQDFASYSHLLPSRSALFDLGVTPPTKKTLTLDRKSARSTSVFADATGAWAVGDDAGMLYTSALPSTKGSTLGCGMVTSVAATAGRFVAATASGQLAFVDLVTHAVTYRDQTRPTVVELSKDGATILLAGGDLQVLDHGASAAAPVVAYSLPSWTQLFSIPWSGAAHALAVSDDGQRFVFCGYDTHRCRAVDRAGATILDLAVSTTLPANSEQPMILSPDGLHIAVETPPPTNGTRLYAGGTFLTTLSDNVPAAFLANDQFFTFAKIATNPYWDAALWDVTATSVPSPVSLGKVLVRRGGADRVLVAKSIPFMIDTATGATVWDGPQTPVAVPSRMPVAAPAGATKIVFVDSRGIAAQSL